MYLFHETDLGCLDSAPSTTVGRQELLVSDASRWAAEVRRRCGIVDVQHIVVDVGDAAETLKGAHDVGEALQTPLDALRLACARNIAWAVYAHV